MYSRKIVMLTLCLGFVSLSLAGEVPTDANDIRPLLPGQSAPSFEATDAYGETYTFASDSLERPAIIIFYRGGWCPICNIYWSDLRKVEDKLTGMDLDLIFLSADGPHVLADAVAGETEKLKYQLLSDGSSEIAQAFGIAFKVDDATYQLYKDRIVDLEEASGYKHRNLPAPAAFIVGTDGVIRFSYVNPDYRVRLHPDVLLAAARTMPEYRLGRR
ncbi:MAG: peroxiredoxin-like family protein [Xanthomonadales bacterium]|nr:peroxiredoxin-like family protein [Xanthomonadales bacterium]